MSELRVFTFSPGWGLPSMGPFALKLLAWLELAGIPYTQVHEDDSRKGPLGKNPWIEIDGERMGDSERIIDFLGRRFGVDLDAGIPADRLAAAHAWRRAFEEHFHQVLEWELFVHPAGRAAIESAIAAQTPPVIGALIANRMCAHFRKQLAARGIGRHPPEAIAAKGRTDLDALAAFLGGRPFLTGERPTVADLAVFGQIAPVVKWPMETPVARYARTLPAVAGFCDRLTGLCFEKESAAAA